MGKNELRVTAYFGENTLTVNIKSEKELNILMEFIEEMNSKRKNEEKTLPKVSG